MANAESIRLVGYARVSTTSGQETHLQIDALKKAGVSVIYEEKTSSVGARPELHKLLDELKRVIAWSFTRWIGLPVLSRI